MSNYGIKNEKDFVLAINNRSFKDQMPMIKEIIRDRFPDIRDDEVLKAEQPNRYGKPDVVIWRINKPLYISIKCGSTGALHTERIKSFILFCRKNGISVNTQKILLYYIYGDGTMDGTGVNKVPFFTLFKNNMKHLYAANRELNSKEFMAKAIERFIFFGTEGRVMRVDYVIYGTVNQFIWAKREDIVNFLLTTEFTPLKAPHIGPFTLQPYATNKRKKYANTYKGHVIQVKWKYMVFDMQRIVYRKI